MIFLRAYLLVGLLAHKVLWEVLKRRGNADSVKPVAANPSLTLRLVKGIKMAILLGILVQTVLPWEILPLPFAASPLRLVGIVVYTLGLITAILGRIHLGDSWSDIETPRAGEEVPVVTQGVYSYIRHPIYAGDLLLLLGLELCLHSWLVLGAVALIPVVFTRAVKEEKLLASRLQGYDLYIQRTKRFIPFVV
jgi:protein-S-isoprenylcysteine O-methyltransferase Ste14